MSKALVQMVYDVFYLTGIKSDHSAICVTLEINSNERGPGYWKLNTLLLSDHDYVAVINKHLQSADAAYSHLSAVFAWERIKQDVKNISIQFSREKAKKKRDDIANLSAEITNLEERYDSLNETQLELLKDNKHALDILLAENIHGVIFRSRCKWYEEGEKNTKYFYLLEKAKYGAKTCNVLINDEGVTISEQKDILSMQQHFYQQLYTADSSVVFHMSSKPEYKVPDEMRADQDSDFTITEIALAVKQMKNGKCPGPDGIPIDFYKMFWPFLSPMIMRLIEEVYSSKCLHVTASWGILNLIPKKNKDSRFLKNLRPITLLNADYKIIEKVIVNRMLPALDIIINNDQRGFLPGRRITTNIRKIFDIILIAAQDEIPGIILQIDFAKAFDRVEMCAIKGSLQYFGFAQHLITWMEILYKDFYVRVQNNGYMSEKIHIQRSVHQGAPASSVIFVCIAELLAHCIHEDDQIKGIYVKDIENVLNQYADDTDLSLDASDDLSLKKVMSHLSNFRNISGCMINYDKTNVYRIGSLRKNKAMFYTEEQLNWTEGEINVLGVDLDIDIHHCLEINYRRVTDKVKAVLAGWKSRSISLIGKVMVINSLAASLYVYPMSVLPKIPEKFIKEAESTFEAFLWNGHKPKVSLEVLKLPKNGGGLGLVDLKLKDESLKVAWVQQIFSDTNVEVLANHMLACPLQNLLWKCNIKPVDLEKILPRNASNAFWLDVLSAWSKISFSPEVRCDPILWYNSLIQANGKPFVFKNALERGLVRPSQLLEEGAFMSPDMAQNAFGLTTMQYNCILASLPKEMKKYIKSGESGSPQEELLADYLLCGRPSSKAYKDLNNNLVPAIARKAAAWQGELTPGIFSKRLNQRV